MIRAQNDIDKVKKESKKPACYFPSKGTWIYTERTTQLHKHRKENSCPGNNCRTGSGICTILEGMNQYHAAAKPPLVQNTAKVAQEYINRVKIQKTQNNLLILLTMRMASSWCTGRCVRSCVSKQW